MILNNFPGQFTFLYKIVFRRQMGNEPVTPGLERPTRGSRPLLPSPLETVLATTHCDKTFFIPLQEELHIVVTPFIYGPSYSGWSVNSNY